MAEKYEKITKRDLIKRLADKGYTDLAADVIWGDVIEVLEETFVEKKGIKLVGLGSFVIRDIKPREITHPYTKERTVIPGHTTVKFVPGQKLKEEIANGFIAD